AARREERTGLPVYVGMRHWAARIKDAVAQMAADGIERADVICMAPHYSTLSSGAERKRPDAAPAQADRRFEVILVESWHTQPDYLATVAANVRATLGRYDASERGEVLTVFTAHSLPEFIIERGEPYDRQLRETAQLLADRLALPDGRWMFS